MDGRTTERKQLISHFTSQATYMLDKNTIMSCFTDTSQVYQVNRFPMGGNGRVKLEKAENRSCSYRESELKSKLWIVRTSARS